MRPYIKVKGILYYFIIILLSFLSQSCSSDKRPNILLVIADDMSFGQLSFDGCKGINTPNIDKLAARGVYFENAYCSAPSCSPSRAAILTGRNGYELESGAVLFGTLPAKFSTYTDLLEDNGYLVGYTGKGWGPGDIQEGGRQQNPAGKPFNKQKWKPFPDLNSNGGIFDIDYASNFQEFLSNRVEDQAFCFWYGAFEPHRVFDEGIGIRAGKKLSDVQVPEFLPDTKEVRTELLDFYFEIEWIDTQLGRMMDILEKEGELENTIIVFTSDNGMPFPRAKCTLYEHGTHVPLVVYWPEKMSRGGKVKDFVNLADLAPTFLDAAGIVAPKEMTARSLINILTSDKTGQVDASRDFVVSYKERHSIVQENPKDIAAMRSIREGDYLLIWNLFPDLWPLGHIDPRYNPFLMPFGDVDDGRTKEALMKMIHEEKSKLFELTFLPKNVEFELYDVKKDPFNLTNLAKDPAYAEVLIALQKKLESYLYESKDPRLIGGEEVFTNSTYHGIQGLSTGFLPLQKWNDLDPADKQKAQKRADSLLLQNKEYLTTLGWDMAVIDSLK